MPLMQSDSYGDFRVQVVVTSPPWYENCCIVTHIPSGEQLIFDPGGNANEILSVVKENGGKVMGILLTHGHEDHIGAVSALQAALGIPCRAHMKERYLLEGGYKPSSSSFEYFDDSEKFALGGTPFKMYHTPGHTLGGVVYDFGAFALTGDTLFNHGVGRTDFPGGNGRSLVESISRILTLFTPNAVLYCGHGPNWVADEARAWWSQMRV